MKIFMYIGMVIFLLMFISPTVYADDDAEDQCKDVCKKIFKQCEKEKSEKECKPAYKKCKNICEDKFDDDEKDDDSDDKDDNDKDDDDKDDVDPTPEPVLPPESEVEGGSTILVQANIHVIMPDGSIGPIVTTLLCPYNQCKFYAIPFWADDSGPVTPEPDPDPEPGPNDWVTKENFDSRSCLKCHDKDGDDQRAKFDYKRYINNVEMTQQTHKEHKERQCKSCHIDPR